jgi:hypothetical protein
MPLRGLPKEPEQNVQSRRAFECDDFSIFGMKLAPHISRRHVASPATLYEDRNQ